MSDPELNSELERVRFVAEAAGAVLGNGPGRATLATQRAALLSAVAGSSVKPAKRLTRWSWALLAPAFALAVVVLWLLGRPAPALARFDGRNLGEREVIRAQRAHEELLSLADGSTLALAPQTELELTELSPSRARLTLRGGSVAAKVTKAPARLFSIYAGAYEVRVVGTTFSVQSTGSEIRVAVEEGRVLVRGGNLPLAGALISAGQLLDTRALAETNPGARDSAPPATEEAPPARAVSAPREPRAPPSWSELARSGRYRDALALAEQAGFEPLTRSLADDELLLLASTARYAGDAVRAKLAFGRLRSRFPGSPSAGLAALYLARLAESHDHDRVAAARWLRVFLAESPHSDMAVGARASLIDIALKQGQQAEARRAAADYLAHHPQGPHAGQARALLTPIAP